MKIHFVIIAFSFLTSILAAPFDNEKPFNQLQTRMKKATVQITYASPQYAETANLTIAPLPDNKKLAFTARWDDNNLRHVKMRDVMTRHGYKCGFYLNSNHGNEKQIELARELVKKGCGLGAHSMTHPMLTTLNLNEIHWEILACKIERESDSDKPIVAYGFSFCNFRNPTYPDVHKNIAESFIRSGIHHVVNPAFIKEEDGVYPETFSVSRLMVPGDINPLPEKFDKCLQAVLNDTKYLKQNPIATLAFHTRHTDEGFANLEKSLIKYKNNPDWWYCEPNEYAAYRYRIHNTSITKKSVENGVATYDITSPVDGDAGRSVPLTFLVAAKPLKVEVDGKIVATEKKDDGYAFNIFTSDDGTMPEKIDTVANPDNSLFSDKSKSQFEKFPNIIFHLHYDASHQTAILTASNQNGTPITNFHAILRLPPMFKRRIIPIQIPDLAPKSEIHEKINLNEQYNDIRHQDGMPYFVAQVDFSHDNHIGRIYATCRAKRAKSFLSCPRDAAMIIGPFKQKKVENLLAMSQPNTQLSISPTPYSSTKWWKLPETGKQSNSDCVILTFPRSPRTLLQKLAKAGESGNFALAFSFIPPQNIKVVTLNWPGWNSQTNKIKKIFLNGKEYSGEQRKLPVLSGKNNRLIIVPDISADYLGRVQQRFQGISLTPEVEWKKL